MGFNTINTGTESAGMTVEKLPNIIEVGIEASKDGVSRGVIRKKDGTWLLVVTHSPHGKWVPFVPTTVKSDKEGKPIIGKPITPEQALEFYNYSKSPEKIELPSWAVSE